MPEDTIPHNRRVLVVAQQDLQGHHRRTEHWALVVVSPTSRAVDVLQLAGNMDTFHFESLHVPDVLKIANLCGGCRIGEVATDSIGKLQDMLGAQRIVLHDRMWDCQDWLLEAVRTLKEEKSGWVEIDDWFTERDHYFERIFAQT